MNAYPVSGPFRRARRNERGASAVVVALLMTAIMAVGALGLDISKLVFERQQVRAAVDAAAQIGAARLNPTPLDKKEADDLKLLIKDAAVKNYGTSTYGKGLVAKDVTVDFFCVVATLEGSVPLSPKVSQIPDTCDPDPSHHNYTPPGMKCDARSCAIPCKPEEVPLSTFPKPVCNAIRVGATKEVLYVLAPAVGIPNSYATASTVSCQGTCGGDPGPNPLNVVVMADRTPSMFNEDAPPKDRDKDLVALRSGMLSMLKIMNTKQQYLAFGAIQKSVPKDGDLTSPPSRTDYTFTNTTKSCTDWWGCSYTHTGNTFNGTWVPVQFSNDYINGDPADPQWNLDSDIYQSMSKLTYSNMTSDGTTRKSYSQADGLSGNTHLAAALKGAARYIMDKEHNNINVLDKATKRPSIYGPARDIIILETDGSPSEIFNNDSDSALSLDDPEDVGNPDGGEACNNFKQVADNAKAEDITIITIGFGAAADPNTLCERYGTPVKDVLAAVASKKDGKSAKADHNCMDPDTSVNGEVFKENHDGDNYYCAANGDDLKKVFLAALGDLTSGTKFMGIEGVGD